ncbi:hypothetical protein FKM82_009303 [Ascaphus truei]
MRPLVFASNAVHLCNYSTKVGSFNDLQCGLLLHGESVAVKVRLLRDNPQWMLVNTSIRPSPYLLSCALQSLHMFIQWWLYRAGQYNKGTLQ